MTEPGALRQASRRDELGAEEDLIAEGDRVASRWIVSGTHTCDFMDHSPTGRRYEITGMSIYRISRGMIVEGWVNDDSLGMLRQLGIVES